MDRRGWWATVQGVAKQADRKAHTHVNVFMFTHIVILMGPTFFTDKI